MPLRRSSEIKVGLFAIVTLGAFLTSVILLTSKTSLFRETITLHTSFKDIAGLIDGSEVRLSGVTVGFVEGIEFADDDPTGSNVLVHFSLDDRGLGRVMKDGKATIASLGLLGKKFLALTPGSAEAGPAEHDDVLEGIEPASMAEALDKAGVVLDNIKDTAAHLKTLFGSIAGEKGYETDLSQTISSIRRIVGEVETGQGTLHALIYDAQKTQILNDLMATVEHIKNVVAQVEKGPGNVHELIYGEQVQVFLDDLEETSVALRQVISDIRNEEGIVHSLIYDPEKTAVLEDLKKSAANLAKISERIERGEGTIGGLLIDPTIYEDMKKLTGEVERNRVLKTYIRYVVRKRETDLEESMQPPPNPPLDETDANGDEATPNPATDLTPDEDEPSPPEPDDELAPADEPIDANQGENNAPGDV